MNTQCKARVETDHILTDDQIALVFARREAFLPEDPLYALAIRDPRTCWRVLYLDNKQRRMKEKETLSADDLQEVEAILEFNEMDDASIRKKADEKRIAYLRGRRRRYRGAKSRKH